jgi:hypothetical protein
LKAGDRVQARYKETSHYRPATILRSEPNGSYRLIFDGYNDTIQVPLDQIRYATHATEGQQISAPSVIRTSAQPSLLSHSIQAHRFHGTRHVFIDNSNLFKGAQGAVGGHSAGGGTHDPTVRIDPQAINALLQPQGDAVVVLKPAATAEMWQTKWRDAGFKTRICDDDDDFLHAQIYRRLDPTCEPATLVLVTGDGNDNDGWATFPDAVRRAARLGWHVECWSWQHCRSKVFRQLAAEFPEQIELFDLNDHDGIIYRSPPRTPNRSAPQSPQRLSADAVDVIDVTAWFQGLTSCH